MSESITGYIDHIIFRNEDNGYTVMVLKGGSEEDELTCVGSFPVVTQGASVELEGNFTQHPVYGKQFQAVRLTEKMPEDALAMERYLGSGAIKGIGAALAGRIVRHFGDDTFQIVENEPERLSEVKGISEKKAREIAMQIAEKSDMRKAMMFLQKYGISLNLGAKIYQKYGDSVYSVLQENPYRLADDISGVGFKIADEIAYRIGIHTDSDYRIKSGMVYTLLQATGEGHVYLPKDELFQRAAELLGVDSSYMEKHLVDLAMDRKIVQKEQGDQILIYPAQYYYLELNTARMLRELDIFCPEDEKIVERRIVQIEKETGTVLDEMQKKAVQEAAGHGLLILTGGPGTGKTTTINAIIRYFEGEGAEIRLAAPTGRAAKRMTEATGYEAQTIHRLLELSGMPEDDREGQPIHFERNAENPLETDVIIIDEMSMVDIHLIHSLLMAVTAGTRLILVGDENQLPSVGPGNVFRELIQCGAVPVTVLDQIFRQGKGSLIAANAYKMLNNSAALEYGEDFVFLPADNAECAAEIVEREYRRMTAELGIDQVQVLTPYRKSGAVSVNALNERLWNLVNPKMPGKAEMKVRGRIFREKDKVIHNKNKNEISNGDTGFITGIYLDEDNLEVSRIEFPDNRCVEYSSEDMEMIEHAYATTVHKSQGSEYSVVILPWMPMFYKMLRRNILYTAITRAKVKLILVGSKQAVYRAVHNTESDKRNTRLGEMILKERYALESREKIVPLPDADRTKYEQIAMNF